MIQIIEKVVEGLNKEQVEEIFKKGLIKFNDYKVNIDKDLYDGNNIGSNGVKSKKSFIRLISFLSLIDAKITRKFTASTDYIYFNDSFGNEKKLKRVDKIKSYVISELEKKQLSKEGKHIEKYTIDGKTYDVLVNWDLYKGQLSTKATESFIGFIYNLSLVNGKLISNYINNVEETTITIDDIEVKNIPRDLKETINNILKFKKLSEEFGDRYTHIVSLSSSGKTKKFVYAVETKDGAKINIAPNQYKKFCLTREEHLKKVQSIGAIALTPYLGALETQIIKLDNIEIEITPFNFEKRIETIDIFLKEIEKQEFEFIKWAGLTGKNVLIAEIKKDNVVYRVDILSFNNGNWNGGITRLTEYLRHNLDQWKQDSFKLYNYRCAISGTKKDLIVHHLYNFSNIVRETMEEINLPIYETVAEYTPEELLLIIETCQKKHNKYGLGVVLCEEIHKEFHSEYGLKNNTPEQFEEFKNNKLNQKK